MRLFALETTIAKLKKQLIAEGGEELLSARHHIFTFLIPIIGIVILTVGFLVVEAVAIMASIVPPSFVDPLLYLWLVIALYFTARSLIAWRFNFLIVTTEKIVIVKHISFFHQEIHPIHIENIRSIRAESQFPGIGHCGILHLYLEEKNRNKPGNHHTVPSQTRAHRRGD